MANNAPLIVWFRQDLRLDDNPALTAAAREGAPVLPVFVLDDANAAEWRLGAASRWWLHQSLAKLNDSLDGKLLLMRGDARALLPSIALSTGARGVYWNRVPMKAALHGGEVAARLLRRTGCNPRYD